MKTIKFEHPALTAPLELQVINVPCPPSMLSGYKPYMETIDEEYFKENFPKEFLAVTSYEAAALEIE